MTFYCFKFILKNLNTKFLSLLYSVVGVGNVGAWMTWIAWGRRFLGGVGQILAWLKWVARAHKNLT